jgi:glycerol kinase
MATPEPAVLAIDAGTTGVRSMAVDGRGRVVAGSYREITQHFPRPGWVEHDPEEIWTAVRTTMSEVTRSLGARPVAIGVTNQRETVVAWSRATSLPLARAVVWQDRRTADRCAELAEDGLLPKVRSITGLVLDPYFSATKLEWLMASGDVEPGPDLAVGTIDSWILWKLTGGTTHATDATNASRTMLYDIGALAWSEELCSLFDVPESALPEVRESSCVFGYTSTEAPCGPGVPIAGVAGDQQAALFGQAAFETGEAKSTYGTGSFVLMNVGSHRPEPADGLLTTLAWVLEGPDGPEPTYALEGSIFATGAAVQWLRDQLGIIDDVTELEALAIQCDDSGGVVLVPAFAGLGSPWWDPYARAVMVGMTRGTGRAEIARATIESIVYQTRDVVDAMTLASGRPLKTLKVDGGASAMGLMLQLQADQLGVPVRRPAEQETTVLGAAYLAGLATGVWGSLEDIASNWSAGLEVEPRVEADKADAGHRRWLRAVELSRGWARE